MGCGYACEVRGGLGDEWAVCKARCNRCPSPTGNRIIENEENYGFICARRYWTTSAS